MSTNGGSVPSDKWFLEVCRRTKKVGKHCNSLYRPMLEYPIIILYLNFIGL